MTNKLIIPVVALVVAAGGVVFWQTSNSDSPKSANQTSVSNVDNKVLANTPAMTAAEAKFRGYVGDDYDRYYMANMIGHHQSAVEMANIALANTQRPEIIDLSKAIISSQNKEIVSMIEWQAAWGYPASTGDKMVDHSAMGMMEDMAVVNENLKKLSGEAFDKAFLQNMIVHHESAVAMSRPATDNAKHPEIKTLATDVIKAQTKEILQMRAWHAEWGFGEVPAEPAKA